MSWWVSKNQLDEDQVKLIEDLDIDGSFLVYGPPGSGKTNVLLRRAQFLRANDLPNVVVLTFTRPLTEFLKTGCYNESGSEVFPSQLIQTFESWIRGFYHSQNVDVPNSIDDFNERKAELAKGALSIAASTAIPKHDAILVDEAQDLLPEEVALIRDRSDRLFFVGDDRQKIYGGQNGLDVVRALRPQLVEEPLKYHYRLAPEICAVADRILTNASGQPLSRTANYKGPRPAHVAVNAFSDRASIKNAVLKSLLNQIRVYGDFLAAGEKLGVVVPRKKDREELLQLINENENLAGKAQIVRAWSGNSSDTHVVELDAGKPILIMTEKGCKGLEFRALHWLFVDRDVAHRTDELYYTIVTRAKTSLDMYHSSSAPAALAKAYAQPTKELW